MGEPIEDTLYSARDVQGVKAWIRINHSFHSTSESMFL